MEFRGPYFGFVRGDGSPFLVAEGGGLSQLFSSPSFKKFLKKILNFMILYFLKGSSGYIKIGRSDNFPKRLSEIRRGTTDEYVEVLKTFSADDETIIELESDLHTELAADNFKGEWFHDTAEVRAALDRIDRQFNPELFLNL